MEEPVRVEEPEEELRRDPTELIRLLLLGLGLALNLYVLWDQYRDHPEVLVLRHRTHSWWDRTVAGPRRRRRAMRRAEGEVVFEAIQTVEGAT